MPVSTKQALQQDNEEPTEDEYFEQELLDFLQMIESTQSSITNNGGSYTPIEPKDEIECIITRFNKIECVMPSDQWSRVYSGLKQLSQIITSHSESFESWILLRNLFESAKKFRKKYPTAQSAQIQQKQKQKSMNQVLKFAKEFADDIDITMNVKTKMTKSIKQSSKIKQIKKKPIKSESSTSNIKAITQKPSKHVITKNAEKVKKAVPVKTKEEVAKKTHSKSHHERVRDRDRDRSHRHRHRHRSRSRSRSRSRERHRRSRHGHNYRSRSTSKNREKPPPSSSSHHPRSGNTRSHELDEWGLQPPIHSAEYITNMCLHQDKQRGIMLKTDISVDDMEKIPVVYGDSEICHGFNEGRCRLDPCKYHHVCWSCKGRGHPSSICPYKATRPYDAPPSHHKPCVNWNIHGCPGGCLCADRHICLFCRGYHPMRHSAVCAWKYNREIEMNKRAALDKRNNIGDLQNLNPIGQYEHLRLKDEENGTFEDKKGYIHSNTYNKRGSITPPPSMTIPTSFMAKSVEPDETVSITEICVLYNTPSGCAAKYGKNDRCCSSSCSNLNPNTFNGVCSLKHRCRSCFGRHSFIDCPFIYHGIKCFIVNDIVRYNAFPQRVYVVNGFIDDRNHHHRKSSISSPAIKITEVGLDLTAAQIEIAASTLSKIVSSVKMQYKYPSMMIRELPTTISSQQCENKLKLLFDSKSVKNIVSMQSTISQSNWIISFLSVKDRLNAFTALNGCCMQSRELKLSLFDDVNEENELRLITKDEVPVHEHLYYCKYCDIGLFEYGLLRHHLLSKQHISMIKPKEKVNNTSAERVNISECILCGINVMNTTMAEHITSTAHDNSNILMMLSLLRCVYNDEYECKVCNMKLSSSRQYFIHCNTEQHRSGLEEAIEPCPYFNKRGSGCQNERCQFKHVCVGCAAVTPIYRCKRCKNNEVCNMFNKGGAGCWYARGSCHRRHICHYCHGSHPKVGCPKLYPKGKKQFNSQGQEIKPGAINNKNKNKAPPPQQAPPPPNPSYPPSTYPHYNYRPPPPPNYHTYPMQPPPPMQYPYPMQYPPQTR